MHKGLKIGKLYTFRNTLLSLAFPFSPSWSFLSQSFCTRFSLNTSIKPSTKLKSIDTGKGLSKISKFNNQRSIKVKQNHETNSQTTSLYTHDSNLVDNCIFSYLMISPAGYTIRNFRLISELLESFCDTIKADKSLYIKRKILYRDILKNNIIITDPKEAHGFMSMLLDGNLAKEISSGQSKAQY